DHLRILAVDLRDRVNEIPRRVAKRNRPLVASERRDSLREPCDRVVVPDSRAVRRSAARTKPDPVECLLTGLYEVSPGAVEVDRVAANLADRGCGSSKEFWVMSDEIVRTEHATVL